MRQGAAYFKWLVNRPICIACCSTGIFQISTAIILGGSNVSTADGSVHSASANASDEYVFAVYNLGNSINTTKVQITAQTGAGSQSPPLHRPSSYLWPIVASQQKSCVHTCSSLFVSRPQRTKFPSPNIQIAFNWSGTRYVSLSHESARSPWNSCKGRLMVMTTRAMHASLPNQITFIPAGCSQAPAPSQATPFLASSPSTSNGANNTALSPSQNASTVGILPVQNTTTSPSGVAPCLCKIWAWSHICTRILGYAVSCCTGLDASNRS